MMMVVVVVDLHTLFREESDDATSLKTAVCRV